MLAGAGACVGREQLHHVVHMAQASPLDVLVLVGEVIMQAELHTNRILLHEERRHD